MHRSLRLVLTLAVPVAAFAAACGQSNGTGSEDDAGAGRNGSDAATDGTAGGFGEGESETSPLTIRPENAVVDVTMGGTAVPVAYQAFVGTSNTPVAATFTLDVPPLGTFDATGSFKASGKQGGVARVTARSGKHVGTTGLTVRVKATENPGNVSDAKKALLVAGGAGDANFKWLYPYDKTVFARGLLSPSLQFAGSADAVRVKITLPAFEYEGFYGPSDPIRVALPQTVWDTATKSAGPSDALAVEVTKIKGTSVAGPVTETWKVAQGNLRGTLYYNSYDSPLAGGGAVLRLKPGETAPTVLMGGSSGCVVCHSVSANGNVMAVAHQHAWDAFHDLTKAGPPVLSRYPQNTTEDAIKEKHVYSFAGLYPDGSLAVGCDDCVDEAASNGNTTPSKLYDTRTGQAIAAPGLDDRIKRAATPTFSPDGKLLAYNKYGNDVPGKSLAIANFDLATKTFSNPFEAAQDTTLFPAWPSFTPDSKWILYQLGTTTYTLKGSRAELAALHVPSRTTAKLDAINGFLAGKNYLPFGDGETRMNYEPTVLPVAAGGYYWVIFTSRRPYGNTLNQSDPFAEKSPRKKLWVAAIDIDSGETNRTMATDISHPPFYLPGQELAAGNMRGFWALDPCKSDGNACDTGDECCNGFCRDGVDGGVRTCSPGQGCANELEKCTQTSDCCSADQGVLCLNGHCGKPAPR
ncbi:MAG: hypothetical protein U0169_20690 [Polyangiaceae bacterium]